MASDDFSQRISRTKGREATAGVIPGRFALSVGKPDLPSPEGWRWTALTDVAQLESGHTPSRRNPEFWNGGVPWIGIKDAVENHGRTIQDTYQHVSQLGLQKSSARLLPARTVCLSRTASVGFVVVMGRPMATSQDFVNWVCGPDIDPDFFKYVLVAENDSLFRFASGTTHQTIYYPEAKAFHALLPPLPTQRAIAHILGALDDKIELNRKTNETLEAMARALFQSWFVDFDPVRAKAAGRAPEGMDEATAKLFPSEFEASELGEVPKGWHRTTLGDAVQQRGGVIQTGPFGSQLHASDYVDRGVPVVMPKDIANRSVSTDSIARIRSQDAGRLARHQLARGDIVYSRRGDVERHALIHDSEVGWLCGTGCLLVRPGIGQSWSNYASLWLDHPDRRTWISQHAIGATMPNLNTGILASVPLTLPSDRVLKSFEEVVGVWAEHGRLCRRQSESLAALRDALLPKLLSGELAIRDAETFVSRAV